MVYSPESRPPMILFFNGDEVEYVDHIEITTKDGPKWRVQMTLFEKTIEKYGFREEVIKNEEDGYPPSTLVREYPSSYIVTTSSSPYSTWYIALCNIKGILIASTKIQEMADMVKRYRKDIFGYKKELRDLRERVAEQSESLREIEDG